MAELKPHNGFYLWKYLPSRAVSILFAVLFVITTAGVAFRMARTKTWYVTVFCVGGLCKSIPPSPKYLDMADPISSVEVIGLAIRAYCLDNTDQLIPYILQNVFVLVAPALFAASIYMVLGRIIRGAQAEAYSLVRPTWLTKIFVAFDVISFFVQGGGAGLMANEGSADAAEGIVIGGLLVQIIAFAIFVVVMFIFQRRMKKNPTEAARSPTSTWAQDVNTLYLCSILIMIRSIFRVAEFALGHDSYLLETEWPLYVFDIVLMWVMMVIFIVRYPGYPSLFHRLSKRGDKRGTQLDDMS
jgi:hypothetical protein